MSHRKLSGKQSLLRIFCGDFDKCRQQPLYGAVLEEARKDGLAGCTVLRASEGYGRGKCVHTEATLEGAGERPILIEIVDEPGRVAAFWEKIEPMLAGALVTEESVTVHHYHHSFARQTP